jgi:AcrR family transcriptional regulator
MSMQPARHYGGQSHEARVSERREKLMQAAADLYGRLGPEGASVTAICAEAGLTPRYFYESFPNREALLLAVFQIACDRLIDQIRAELDPVAPAESGLRIFFSRLGARPDVARVFLSEPEHNPALRAVGRATMDAFSQLLMPGTRSDFVRAGAIGAILRIARLWLETGAAEPVDDMVRLTRRFVEAGIAAGN